MARTRTGEIAGAPSPGNMTTPMDTCETGYGRHGEVSDAPRPGSSSVPLDNVPTSPFQRINEIPGAPRP